MKPLIITMSHVTFGYLSVSAAVGYCAWRLGWPAWWGLAWPWLAGWLP